MLDLPEDLGAALAARTTSLCVCWAVEKTTGEVVRGTSHDRDVTISTGQFAGTYPARRAIFSTDVRSTSDGSVSNVDVEGAFRVEGDIELQPEEIEAGFFDEARAVLLLVDWRRPNIGQKVLRAGRLGEFVRDSDGRFRSEVRGREQQLAQQITRSYSERCDVKIFGDARCKFDVSAMTRTGTVTRITPLYNGRLGFRALLDPGPAPRSPMYYVGGRVLFTSGALDGVIREVRDVIFDDDTSADDVTIVFWDETPYDIEVGMTFELPPGCDRTYDTCKLIHENLVNFRGHGIYASGRDALMRGPSDPARTIDARFYKTEEEWQAILAETSGLAALFALAIYESLHQDDEDEEE